MIDMKLAQDKKSEVNLLLAIDRIDCQLSPENLHCDGEITAAQAKVKYNRLMKERGALEKQLGRSVQYNG